MSVALLRSVVGIEGPDESIAAVSTAEALADQVDKSLTKTASGPAEAQESSYTAVDGFVLQGKQSKVPNMEACQSNCDARLSCPAFSYNRRDQTCILADKKLKFNNDWELFVRGLTPDATGALVESKSFHGFPGMFEDGFRRLERVSKQVCLQGCLDDSKCRSYSYNKEVRACLLSNWPVKYDPDFKYYENNKRSPQEMEEDSKTVQQVHKVAEAEKILGMSDRNVRKTAEEKKETQQKAYQKVEQQKQMIKSEADAKTKVKLKEMSAKAAHNKKLKQILESGIKHGEYAESVHKSHQDLTITSMKLRKEKRAKTIVLKTQAQQSLMKAQEENKEAAEERQLKKTLSYESKVTEKSQKEGKYLQLRSQAFEIHAKAVELVKEQREVIDVEVPGDSKRDREEERLLREKNQEKVKLQKLQSQLAHNKRERAAKKQELDQEWAVKKAAFTAETESITKESKEKIQQAEADARRMKAKEKANKLKAEANSETPALETL